MTRPVFLVGSVPFTDTEEVFRRCAAALGKYTARLPDGERGGWLPGEDFRRMRGMVEGRGQSLLNPPISQTVRMSEGTSTQELAFETLHYLPKAQASYEVFSRLKRSGLVPAATRYQVSIPSAFTGCIHFDRDQVRQLWPAYEAALFREVKRIIASIPADDLAISWDVVDFGISLANPDPSDIPGHSPTPGQELKHFHFSVPGLIMYVDRSHATVHSTVWLMSETGADKKGGVTLTGTYDDKLTRVGGQWKFAYRFVQRPNKTPPVPCAPQAANGFKFAEWP